MIKILLKFATLYKKVISQLYILKAHCHIRFQSASTVQSVLQKCSIKHIRLISSTMVQIHSENGSVNGALKKEKDRRCQSCQFYPFNNRSEKCLLANLFALPGHHQLHLPLLLFNPFPALLKLETNTVQLRGHSIWKGKKKLNCGFNQNQAPKLYCQGV